MIRAGLTGGMGCGKSFVAKTMEKLGCRIIRADELGHRVLAKGGVAYGPVVERFGEGILRPDGEIDRKLLAVEVFNNPERLEQLNSIVHPAVIELEEELLRQAAKEDPSGIAVVEAAILIETGSYRRFEKLIVVVCTPEQQVERAMARDGLSADDVRARLSRQMSLEEKRRYADYVIDTSGTIQRTVEQTNAVVAALRSLRK